LVSTISITSATVSPETLLLSGELGAASSTR
jgi:hypothetical protein